MAGVSRRSATRPATPEQLVLVAEQLFARDGVDGVSLRQIAVESGLRNPASVQYHFGSKEALLRAVIELRLPPINEHRLELLDQLDADGRGHDLRGLVDAMVRPLLELEAASLYIDLISRVGDRDDFADAYVSTGPLGRSMGVLDERLDEALGHLSPVVAANRKRLATTLMVAALRRHRSRSTRGESEPLSDEAFGRDLVEAIVGLLSAPEADG
jgi:AcrR family transcriptional regulator